MLDVIKSVIKYDNVMNTVHKTFHKQQISAYCNSVLFGRIDIEKTSYEYTVNVI